MHIYVDADACPVKQEVYKVARRLGLEVTLVSASYIQPPPDDAIGAVAVGKGLDAADDWIAAQIQPGDICITADIPLAARCLKAGAHAIGPRGKPFSEDSIGDALATRELMRTLREAGLVHGGPAPLSPRERSEFLDQLDQLIQRVRRRGA